jgi:iron complex outermembrane receptor protein
MNLNKTHRAAPVNSCTGTYGSRRPVGQLACTFTAWLSLSPAFAAQSPAAGATEDGGGLEEIVVTANRREQNEMSVGVSVNVLGGQDLSKLSLRDAAQITAYVPNMVESAIFGPGVAPNLAIRGVGMNDYNAASESPIAGYIDDVYVVYGGAYSFPLYDMDRVEVLRGPQGTLFGRNSTAGAMQFISEKPKQGFEASVGGEYGSYDTRKGDAMVNLPLIQDRLALRVSAHYQDNDGWLDNPSGLTGPGGQLITQDGRVQLLWTPNDEVTDLFKISYDHASGDNYSMLHAAATNTQVTGNRLLNPGENFYGTCPQCDMFGNPSLGWVNNVSNSPKIIDANATMVSNELNWKAAPNATITFITAYNRTYNEYEQDCDGTTMELCATHYINTETQFSQEIRAFIDQVDLRTTLGVYALSQHVSAYLPIAFDIPVTIVPGHEGLMVGSHDTQDAEGYAIFGNVEKDLAPQWTLTTGLRGAMDRKHIQESIGDFLDCPSDPGFAGFLNPGKIINATIPTCGNVGYGSFTDANAQGHNKFTSYTWSGKIELDFKPNAQTLTYLSLSHGSKAAAFSTGNVALALFPQNGGSLTDLYVKPESVYSIEAGVKLRALDDRLQLTSAIYYYNYPSFQELSFVGINDSVNTHKATNYGAELDLTCKPLRPITLNVNAGATRMRVKDVVDAYGASATRDAPLAPHFTVNAYARYDYRLSDGANLGSQIEMRHTGSFYTEADNFADELVPSSTRYNLRFDYTSASRGWDVGAYVNNLLNSHDLSEVYDLAADFGLQFSIPMAPRWFGVQAHYRFN